MPGAYSCFAQSENTNYTMAIWQHFCCFIYKLQVKCNMRKSICDDGRSIYLKVCIYTHLEASYLVGSCHWYTCVNFLNCALPYQAPDRWKNFILILHSWPIFANPWIQELWPRNLFAYQNHLENFFKYGLPSLPQPSEPIMSWDSHAIIILFLTSKCF